MFEVIVVRRISARSFVKLVFVGQLFSVVPLLVLLGILSFLGVPGVHINWNSEAVSGVMVLPEALLAGCTFAIVFTVFAGGVGAIGLWIYSRFWPLLLSIRREPAGV